MPLQSNSQTHRHQVRDMKRRHVNANAFCENGRLLMEAAVKTTIGSALGFARPAIYLCIIPLICPVLSVKRDDTDQDNEGICYTETRQDKKTDLNSHK
jgi:hypothetical protein